MRLELILLILLLILGGTMYYKDGGFVNPFSTASSTPSNVSVLDSLFGFFDFTDSSVEKGGAAEEKSQTAQGGGTSKKSKTSASASQPAPDSAEMSAQAEAIIKRLEELQEDEKVDELRSPVSPYASSFNFSAGKAKATNPNDEYVVLKANLNNTSAIEISGWTLESYVTGSDAEIPRGDRMLLRYNSNDKVPIFIEPGETAYLISGDTPLRTSFKENLCTGYLAQYGKFTPSLDKNCPLPTDELLQYGNIKSDDDECYEYVDTIKRCQEIDDKKLESEGLSSRCDSFIDGVLEYEGCVQKHEEEAGFDLGDWYIYLDSNGELWRSTKEVIRLLDEDDRVVGVIEY